MSINARRRTAALALAVATMGLLVAAPAHAAVDFSTAQWDTPHKGCTTVAKTLGYSSTRTMTSDGTTDEQGYDLVSFERRIAEKCGTTRKIVNNVTNNKTYREIDYADGTKKWPAPRYPSVCDNTVVFSDTKEVDKMVNGERVHFTLTKRLLDCGDSNGTQVYQIIKRYI